MTNIFASASATVATREQDDAGLAPVVVFFYGPKGGERGTHRLTVEQAQSLKADLGRALDSVFEQQLLEKKGIKLMTTRLTYEQLLDLLDDVSAAAENMLVHYGSTMPEADAASRGQIILKARDICNRELRPETGEDDQSLQNTKYLVTVAWPKGSARDDQTDSTVEIDAPGQFEALAAAKAKWAEHDVLAVTKAELQPDGRWTFPKETQ